MDPITRHVIGHARQRHEVDWLQLAVQFSGCQPRSSIGVRGNRFLGGGHWHAFPTRLGWSPRSGGRWSRLPASAEGAKPTYLPPENFEKLIAGNAFSKHFRRFLVILKEWVIPRKRRGELDSDLIPDKCRLARQLTDETTPLTHHISENSSANGCSRNFELFSFFSCFH